MESLRIDDSLRRERDMEILASLRRKPTNQDLIAVGLDPNNPDVLVLWRELLNRPLRQVGSNSSRSGSVSDLSSIDEEASTSSSILATSSPISSEQIEGLNLDFVLPFNLLLKVVIHLYNY